jgi:hypothetical protein
LKPPADELKGVSLHDVEVFYVHESTY